MALRIIIVGGGLSGLTLAHGLRRAGIDVSVFDRDTSAFDRRQGYRLTLDADGSRALAACLPPHLYELSVATSGTLGQSFTTYNERKEVLQRRDVPHASDPADNGVDRQVDLFTLRQILLGDLGNCVHFGKTFRWYDEDADRVVAHFDDHTSADGDLLVGSDGINSRVRQQLLPDAAVADTGIRAIFGRTPLGTRGEEVLDHSTIGNGALAIDAKRHAIWFTTMRFRERPEAAAARWAPDVPLQHRDDYVMWAVLFPADEFDDTHADTARLQDAASACARRFPAEFKKIVDEGDPTDTVLTPIRAATPVSPWTTRRVTLMGDAIHAMPPVGARGANTALNDARVLTEQLVAVHNGDRNLLPAIRSYEDAMLTYGFDAVRQARAELQEIIGTAA